MASSQGDRPGGEESPSPGGARWSGSSTPPDVYGSFSYSNLVDDLDALEATQEDIAPPDMRTAHNVRAKMLNHVQELEESGEYDIRALAPLRHLLDQDWTDPNVRSRLKNKVEAHDQALRSQAQAAPPPQEGEGVGSPPPPGSVRPATTDQPAASPPQEKAANPPSARPPVPKAPLPPSAATPSDPVTSGSAAPQPAVLKSASAPVSRDTSAAKEHAPAAATAPTPAAREATQVAPLPTLPAQPVPPPSQAEMADIFMPPTGPERPPAAAAPFQWTPPDGDDSEPRRDPMSPGKPPPPLAQPKNPPGGRKPLKLGKGGAQKKDLRVWLIAAGAFAAVAVWALPASLYAPQTPDQPVQFLLTSEPKAEIFRGEERLGETPMLLEAGQIGEGLHLRRSGYLQKTFTLEGPLSEGKVEKRGVKLEVAPVALDWAGLPEGSSLTWNGAPSSIDKLASVAPGTYKLRVAPPARPAVELKVVVPAPSLGKAVTSVAVGPLLEKALARQPALSLTLRAGKGKAPKLPLQLTVRGTGESKAFITTATLDGKAASKLILPGPGTYQVKVPASQTHQAFSKSMKLQEGGSHQLEIALAPVPPKIVSAPLASHAGTASSGNSDYSPPPAYYAPPPTYYSGGGGGGGGSGRIAPPSF